MEKWMCKNNTEKGQQTQLRCQEMCEGSYTPECVGISYNLKTYECFLCFDHILTDVEDDYGEFFEIPKRKRWKFNNKSMYQSAFIILIIITSNTL